MTFAFFGESWVYHANTIKEICRVTGAQSYLELGFQRGDSFKVVKTVVPHCVGVDIRPADIGDIMFVGTTDEFFTQNKETFDVIFVDADHKYESVVKDFENSLLILNKHGILFLHDTDPMDEEHLHPGYCDDAYKIVDYVYENHPELDIVTLPFREAGLSIVTRKKDRRVFTYAGTR